MKKAIFNWSGGKDSALALYRIQQEGAYEIISLLTSVNSTYQRISMHGVRVALLKQQAASLGLPLTIMELPEMPDMEVYEDCMRKALHSFVEQGAEVAIFGDIFLEDLRAYREDKLAAVNLKGVFPLWKSPTDELIREFIGLGFKTIVTCVNDQCLGREFAGRIIDQDFLDALPEHVDPCGENGEFHTFVFDGPIFKKAIKFEVGETIFKQYQSPAAKKDGVGNEDEVRDNAEKKSLTSGFWFCDLIPDDGTAIVY